ncbi:MAG: major capsid protein [Planctomycetota bacterium]
MPPSFTNLSDALQLGDGNIDDIRVDDLLLDAPFLAALPVKESSFDTQHEYLKRTGAPGVGFRALDTGLDNTKATRTKVTVLLKFLDAGFTMDKALYMTQNGPALWREEAVDHLQSALATAEQQLIYGTGAESDGFNGLANIDLIDHIDDSNVIDAGGSGDHLTSVFLVRALPTDVSIVAPDGQVNMEIGEPIETIRETDDGIYDVVRTPINGWMALQPGGAYSVWRIANVDTTEGSDHGLTDDLFSRIRAKAKTRVPTLALTSFEGQASLQQSRTATNPTGAPAPMPTESHGIPLLPSPHVSAAETALVAA